MAKVDTTGSRNTVQVSFMIEKEVKAAVGAAAARHGRTQGEQLAQSIKDGVMLQDLIGQVSDHLSREEKTSDGFTLQYKPSTDTCMLYIIHAVEKAIKDESAN